MISFVRHLHGIGAATYIKLVRYYTCRWHYSFVCVGRRWKGWKVLKGWILSNFPFASNVARGVPTYHINHMQSARGLHPISRICYAGRFSGVQFFVLIYLYLYVPTIVRRIDHLNYTNAPIKIMGNYYIVFIIIP